jgi:uncharacterized membrane protein
MFALLILVKSYLKKKEKLENVNIVIVSAIAKMICTYMRIKIYALATTVNVNNYANFKTL